MESCAEPRLATTETRFPEMDALPLADLKRDGIVLHLERNVLTLTSAPFLDARIPSMETNILLRK